MPSTVTAMPKTQHLAVESAPLSWVPTGTPGLESKPLHDIQSPGGRLEAQLLRLQPGTSLPGLPKEESVEILVVEGSLTGPGPDLAPQGYAVLHPKAGAIAAGPDGCTLFARKTPLAKGSAPVWHPAGGDPWLPGQGGLRVKPLGSVGSHSALVLWPAGERFLPHRHWGGEEIYVIYGTFQDEHSDYPAGTWMQSPHLSQHHPFVTDETVIFVKTGHLPIPAR